MFTRIVEIPSKTGKRKELTDTVNSKVLPILQTQTGFVDEMVLISDADPNLVVALSIWKTKEDAERYHRAQFEKITSMLRPYLEKDPTVRTFTIETSTTHHISAGKAA